MQKKISNFFTLSNRNGSFECFIGKKWPWSIGPLGVNK